MSKFLINISAALISCVIFFAGANAQTIVVKTSRTALVFKVDNHQQLEQAYFGENFSNSNLPDSTNYKELSRSQSPAFPGGGMGYVFEPAIEVVHADGNPSLQLNYVSSDIMETLLFN